MKVSLASDHAGFGHKKEIMAWLKENDHQVLDFGCFSEDSVDYPDYAFPAAEAVAAGIADFGVIICGSGIGVNITCNKVTGIRAANCFNVEMVQLSRQHNNANILNIGARFIDLELAKEMVNEFLYGEFEGGRHMIRVEKIHFLTGW
jgi:ribose 5-phosphate isomerase B